jgi:hypothetical protein
MTDSKEESSVEIKKDRIQMTLSNEYTVREYALVSSTRCVESDIKDRCVRLNQFMMNPSLNTLHQAINFRNIANRNIRRNNSSVRSGVFFHKSSMKWSAYIILDDGVKLHLGRFLDCCDAIAARQRAEIKYFDHLLS